MQKFVLIGGMPRSGTNVTRRVLGSHSDIAIPDREFQFFRDYARGKTVRQILDNKNFPNWGVDYSDLYDQAHSHVYVTVLRRYAEKAGCNIFGEKTPRNEFYLDLAEEWLQDLDLKCVIMMRNPLDVVASYKFLPAAQGRKAKDPGLAPQSAIDWCRSVSIGLAKSRTRPQNYYLLRYEDLVRDPRAKAKDLCDFIGVDFEEERMLSFADFIGDKDNTSFKTQENLQQTHGIYQPDSRKQFLSASEIATIRNICGELAWALGYDDENFFPIHGPSPVNESATTKPVGNRLRRWSKNLFPLYKMHS